MKKFTFFVLSLLFIVNLYGMELIQKKGLLPCTSLEFDQTTAQPKRPLNPLISYIVNAHLASIDERINQISDKKSKKIKSGDEEFFEKIMFENPDLIDIPDSQGRTPLMHAALFAMKPFVEILLKHKAQKNLKDLHGFTALKHAKGKSLKIFFRNEEFSTEFIDLIFGYETQKEDRQMCIKMLE